MLLCLMVFLAPSAGGAGLGEVFWKSDTFVSKFMGSYGFLSEREPLISKSEKILFDRVVPLMVSNPESAAEIILGVLTDESSAALDFTLGNIEFQLEKFDQAVVHYGKAIEKLPDFQRAYRNLGLAQFRSENLDEALEALLSALKLGDRDGDLYGLIGHLHLSKSRYVSSESAYRNALMYAPLELNWKTGLAECLLAQGRYAEASALFDELLLRHPEDNRFLLAQADAFLGLDRLVDAAANYELVRRSGLANSASLANLGDIYLNEGLPKQAAEIYQQTLNGNEFPLSRALRAVQALQGNREGELAKQLIQQLRSHESTMTDSQRNQLLRLRARMAMDDGDDEEAQLLLGTLVKKSPMDGKALLLLGALLRDENKWVEAEDYLKRVLHIQAYKAEAMVGLAQLYVAQERYEKAVPFLRDSLVLRPQRNVQEYLENVSALLKWQAEQ
ncbi:tetratricopeptide repeat protein [Verrucomicrobia bacterium]|nr:tetratricopeptide repeat protein [Verrucomicrobiota bacterium]